LHFEDGSPRAVIFKPPAAGNNPTRYDKGTAKAPHFPGKLYILHNCPVRETSIGLKNITPAKYALITITAAGQAGPDITATI
jgi:hypothetical protein